MTIEEAIKDFEHEYPGYAWTIHGVALIRGFYQGDDKVAIYCRSPFSSGGFNWRVVCPKDNIPSGFLAMKQRIIDFPDHDVGSYPEDNRE